MQRLIFGKNDTQRIVSIEPNNKYVEVFQEDEEGNVQSHHVPSAYFILTTKPLQGSRLLKGDQPYRYGWKTDSIWNFHRQKGEMYKKFMDHYTINNLKENFMVRTGYTYFKGMKHLEPSVLSFDIETNGLEISENSKLYLISNTFRRNGQITRRLFCYDEYANEGDMIIDWCNWVREMNPSIMCGHNIFTYDLPFLNQVAKNNDVELLLGRNNSPAKFEEKTSKFRKDQTQDIIYNKVSVYGRELIDTLFLAVRYDTATKKYISLGLKNIIAQEGLEQKNRVFYDASKIRHTIHIPEERQKIKQYAITDADDGLALYDLMSPSVFYMSQCIPKPFQLMHESASGSQLNSMMVRSYLQEGHSIPKASEAADFEGGMSFGNPGVYSNALKVDLLSAYPSTIISYSIYDKNKDPEQNLLKITKYFFETRKEYKKLGKTDSYYASLSDAYKVLINSLFGFMGAKGLNYNYPEGAALITKHCREYLRKAILWATGKPYEKWVTNENTQLSSSE